MASGGATNAAAASGDAGKVSKGNDIVKYTLEQLLELREANMAATIQVIETLHALGLYEYHGSSPFPSDLRASRMVTRTREPYALYFMPVWTVAIGWLTRARD